MTPDGDDAPQFPLGLDTPVVRLCLEGSRAEFEGRLADAQRCYARAWAQAGDDLERCIAAHYLGHLADRAQTGPDEALRWHLAALRHAGAAGLERTAAFLPSLYLGLGRAYERLGDLSAASRYYHQAAVLGVPHRPE